MAHTVNVLAYFKVSSRHLRVVKKTQNVNVGYSVLGRDDISGMLVRNLTTLLTCSV